MLLSSILQIHNTFLKRTHFNSFKMKMLNNSKYFSRKIQREMHRVSQKLQYIYTSSISFYYFRISVLGISQFSRGQLSNSLVWCYFSIKKYFSLKCSIFHYLIPPSTPSINVWHRQFSFLYKSVQKT